MNLCIDITAEMTADMELTIKNELNQVMQQIKNGMEC